MKTIPIKIIIDDRESKSETCKTLQGMKQVEFSIKRLPVGDYLVDNKLLFERKSLIDLTASIKDGRLFQQAGRLASSQTRPIVLLEGVLNELSDNQMRREAIQGALVTISIVFCIPLLRSQNAEESARLMIYAAQQLQALSGYRTLPRHIRRPKRKRKAQLHLLQSIPEIGPERAHRLLEKFGNVESIFQQEMKQLTSVPGIGKKAAESIRWVVG